MIGVGEKDNIVDNFYKEISGMRFDNVDYLYKKKSDIREKYFNLNDRYKEMYKWYFFYQLCMLKNPLKKCLWDYINKETPNMTIQDIELSKEYRLFCSKREKIRNKEKEEDINLTKF